MSRVASENQNLYWLTHVYLLGYFYSKTEAKFAREEAELDLFGEFSSIQNYAVISAIQNPLLSL